MFHALIIGDIMKITYALLFSVWVMIANGIEPQSYQVDFYQIISNAKEQIKWDCARLVYLLVQDAIAKVPKPLLATPLYSLVEWVFYSDPMKEIEQMTGLLGSKTEIYSIAASIARENGDENAWLVLQVAAEYAQKGWFSRHATFLTYVFGAFCGYMGTSYIKLNKDTLLSYIYTK